MSEVYTGDYAPDLFNEQKRYYLLQAQEKQSLTDAELRDLHTISNTQIRRFVQTEIGDCAIKDGFLITPSVSPNDFLITGGDGTLDDPGVFYLKGYRAFHLNTIAYSDQTSSQPITSDAYTQTVLPELTTPNGSLYDYNCITSYNGSVWAGDSTGNVWQSTDLGVSWSGVLSGAPAGKTFRDITFVLGAGYAVGDYSISGVTVYKSDVPGHVWSP